MLQTIIISWIYFLTLCQPFSLNSYTHRHRQTDRHTHAFMNAHTQMHAQMYTHTNTHTHILLLGLFPSPRQHTAREMCFQWRATWPERLMFGNPWVVIWMHNVTGHCPQTWPIFSWSVVQHLNTAPVARFGTNIPWVSLHHFTAWTSILKMARACLNT